MCHYDVAYSNTFIEDIYIAVVCVHSLYMEMNTLACRIYVVLMIDG